MFIISVSGAAHAPGAEFGGWVMAARCGGKHRRGLSVTSSYRGTCASRCINSIISAHIPVYPLIPPYTSYLRIPPLSSDQLHWDQKWRCSFWVGGAVHSDSINVSSKSNATAFRHLAHLFGPLLLLPLRLQSIEAKDACRSVLRELHLVRAI